MVLLAYRNCRPCLRLPGEPPVGDGRYSGSEARFQECPNVVLDLFGNRTFRRPPVRAIFHDWYNELPLSCLSCAHESMRSAVGNRPRQEFGCSPCTLAPHVIASVSSTCTRE